MKYLLILIASAYSMSIIAQAPAAFNYQGVARTADGSAMMEIDINLRISILETSVSGNSVFTETHETTTSKNGLFTLRIGEGSSVSASLFDIDWSGGPFFLQVEMFVDNNYEILGISQLLSVPYALYAETSGTSYFSGTQNRLIKFSEMGELVDSRIYDDGTNLGLNTDAPSNIFEINLEKDGVLYEKGIVLSRNSGYLNMWNGTDVDGRFQPRISGRAESEISPGLTIAATPSTTGSNSRGILLRAGEKEPMIAGNLLEVDNYINTHLSLSVNGELGIGNDSPRAKVHVTNGDVYIDSPASGIIMRTSNNQCFRYQPDNSGQLIGTPINCPN